jgi:hypothetical protein
VLNQHGSGQSQSSSMNDRIRKTQSFTSKSIASERAECTGPSDEEMGSPSLVYKNNLVFLHADVLVKQKGEQLEPVEFNETLNT